MRRLTIFAAIAAATLTMDCGGTPPPGGDSDSVLRAMGAVSLSLSFAEPSTNEPRSISLECGGLTWDGDSFAATESLGGEGTNCAIKGAITADGALSWASASESHPVEEVDRGGVQFALAGVSLTRRADSQAVTFSGAVLDPSSQVPDAGSWRSMLIEGRSGWKEYMIRSDFAVALPASVMLTFRPSR